MTKPDNGHSDEAGDRKGGGTGGRPGGLVKCPHCGKLVPREVQVGRPAAPGMERTFRCPSCGLEIKERHLA